jgi:hypothetical protein
MQSMIESAHRVAVYRRRGCLFRRPLETRTG